MRCKITTRALAILLAGFIAPGLAEVVPKQPSERLTLAASLDRASKNNARLLLAKKEVAVAHSQLRQAQSLFYPRVNLNLDYVRYRNETLGVTPPELGSILLEAPLAANKSETRGNPLAENLYLGRVGFLQTLYAGGKINTTYKLSKAGVRRAENVYETLRHEIEFETSGYFYRLVSLAQEESLVKEAMLEADKLSKAGWGTHSRLAITAAQADLRRRLGDMQQEEQTVRFNYLRAMGLELFSEVVVEGALDAPATIPPLQTVLVWAKENRAELKETEIQEEVDQLSVELSRAERYPVFLLGGGVEKRKKDFPLDETNWSAALSMNIPIFDGFSSLARIRESKYRADQGRLRRVQLEDQVEMEIRSAYGELRHWMEEARVRGEQKKSLDDARGELFGKKISRESVVERLDYLRWLVEAGVSLIEARYKGALAEAQLVKAIGRSLEDR